jgi:hypothetical protein
MNCQVGPAYFLCPGAARYQATGPTIKKERKVGEQLRKTLKSLEPDKVPE